MSKKRNIKRTIKKRIGIPNRVKEENSKKKPIGDFSSVQERIDVLKSKIHLLNNKLDEPISENDESIYDVVICIPSHNRYEKINRLINTIKSQSTDFKYKIILLNDGSSDQRYDFLRKENPDIIYIKNDLANGKTYHWYCYNQMWSKLRDIKTRTVLQMDDDFILCNSFLNKILTIFYTQRQCNPKVIAISPHLWSFKETVDYEKWWDRKDLVDGIALFDIEYIKKLNYQLSPIEKNVEGDGRSVQVWQQIAKFVIKNNWQIYRCEKSLVYHDGNDDSQLHPNFRNKKKIYTQRFIDYD